MFLRILALERLRGNKDVARDFALMDVQKELASLEPPLRAVDLFRNPYLRKITIIANVLMICQMLSFINLVSRTEDRNDLCWPDQKWGSGSAVQTGIASKGVMPIRQFVTGCSLVAIKRVLQMKHH